MVAGYFRGTTAVQHFRFPFMYKLKVVLGLCTQRNPLAFFKLLSCLVDESGESNAESEDLIQCRRNFVRGVGYCSQLRRHTIRQASFTNSILLAANGKKVLDTGESLLAVCLCLDPLQSCLLVRARVVVTLIFGVVLLLSAVDRGLDLITGRPIYVSLTSSGPVKDYGGFTRSGLRYRLPSPISPVVAEEYQSVVDTESSVVQSSSVPTPLIWDMDGMYGAVKGPRRYSNAVGTIELDDFIQEFDSGGASIGMSGDASSSISEGTSGAVGATEIEEGVKTEKSRRLQEFKRKTCEAYTRMRRLISVTHGVTEAQAVQYWYRILDRELRRKVRDATLVSDASPTLAHVFALSKKIELNMMEERVVTSTFARDTTTTSRIPHSIAQSRPMGGGSGSRGVHTRHP
ncbi:hypothetical protein AXG93_939s1250 [Marchantia polymorpha subsp. ruderalis]|uniref:Uncharacterized protein n=1 Tax=Marchantia polymorpha subsp. ruderalis TaxID=1480154 RepID=A0A176VLY7_MARPO|nr:hypothetical protein AXG93_939s1250 [Marchantia polymorpha subsp. ruderalis]